MGLHFPVKNVMTRRKVEMVGEFDSVTDAVALMDAAHISAVPVKNQEGTHYVGVLSRTDIASVRFLSLLNGKKPEQIQVRQVMNRNLPIFVSEDQPLSDVVALMHRHHIHRVFVSDSNHKISGLISSSDIMKFLVLER